MNTLTQLFDWLLAASLRASLLTLATLLIQAALHRHLGARMRYALWLPVLIVLLMPVFPQSQWSIEHVFKTPPQPGQIAPTVISPPVMESTPVVYEAVAPLSEPFNWQRLLIISSISVSAGMLILGGLSFLLTLRRFKQARHPASDELLTTLAQIAREIHLRHVPRVLIASCVSSPAVTGLLRPTLLLPAEFDCEFTPAEARLVLKHELMHLKRGDLPLNALMCVLMALHWFNPLLWVAFFKIRADREAACDAQVLHNAPNDHRIEYGHALIKVETAFCPRGFSLGFVGIFQRGAALRSRIQSIATHRAPHPAMKVLITLSIVLMTFLGVTRAQQPLPDRDFTIGQSTFRSGDSITIRSVQTTSDTMAVSIDYELTSEDEASLSLYISAKDSGPKPADPRQTATVKKGQGSVVLVHPKPYSGLPHITFYSKGREPIGGIYFGTTAEAAQSQTLSLSYMTESAQEKTGPTTAYIKQKLEKIIIPHIQFRDTSVEECLEYLRIQSRAHDTLSADPATQGISIIYKAGNPASKAAISLDLKEVPVGEALRYVVELANLKMSIQPYAVLVGQTIPAPAANAPEPQSKTAPTTDYIKKKLERIILPNVQFQGATAEESIEYLRVKSREMDPVTTDPAARGVNIIYRPGNSPSTAVISLDLKEVPLGEALRYAVELAGLKMIIQPYAVLIVSADDPELAKAAAAPSVLNPPDKLGEIVITAQETSIDPRTGINTAKGDARCQVGEISIQAAELVCDRKAHELKIHGPFTIILGSGKKHSSTSSESSAVLDLASGKLTTSGPHETKILTPPASNIIIPSVEFRDATFTECIDFMRIKARELDPDKKGANIVVKPGGDASARITMSLKDVPLSEALRYCAELANHKLTSDAQSYFLTPIFAESPADKNQASSPETQPTPSVAEAKAAELRKARPQKYDFAKARLGDVLRFLATDASINFFALPDDNPINQKLVTFSIRASPFEALESLCRANGAALVFDQDRWFIRAADDPKQIGKNYVIPQTLDVLDQDRAADDPEQIGKAYVLPQTRAGVGTILKDISSILDVGETKPVADKPQPSVQFKKEQNSVYVKASRLQHSWVAAYFQGLNSSVQSRTTK